MNPQGHQAGAAGPEGKDVDVVSLAMVATMLLLSIGVCLLVCWGFLHVLDRARRARESAPARAETQAFPRPQLLVRPGAEWKKVHAQEEAKLDGYGWIDRESGTVRIPVMRAMELLIERGLPEVGAGQTRLQLMQSRAGGDVKTSDSTAEARPETTP